VSNDEREGRRDRRMLGRRERFEGARGRDGASVGREDDASADGGRSSVEPSTGSMGSIEGDRNGKIRGRPGKVGN
jgi:hypothetical protein